MQTNFIKSQEIILAGTNDQAKKIRFDQTDAEEMHIQLQISISWHLLPTFCEYVQLTKKVLCKDTTLDKIYSQILPMCTLGINPMHHNWEGS